MKKNLIVFACLYTFMLGGASAQTTTNKFELTGNVGIGTINPQAKLHLFGENPALFLEGDQNSYNPSISLSSRGGYGVLDNYGVTNTFNGINLRTYTSVGQITLGLSAGHGLMSYSENPNLITHNVIGAPGQTANIFQVSKFIGTGTPDFRYAPAFTVSNAGDVGMGNRLFFKNDPYDFMITADDGYNSTSIFTRRNLAMASEGIVVIGTGNRALNDYGFFMDAQNNILFGSNTASKFSWNQTHKVLTVAGAVIFNALQTDNTKNRVLVADADGNLSYRDASTFIGTSSSSVAGATGQYQLNNNGSLGTGSLFEQNGNIGIGTMNTGGYKLAVNGDAIFTKVKVKANGGSWPDYVFQPSYKLPTLQEVERFIKTYKHLPGLPSAKEIEANGLNVGENQAMLLKKIEELTLYVIAQQKEIDVLKGQAKKMAEIKNSSWDFPTK